MGHEADNWNTQQPWREDRQRYQTCHPKHYSSVEKIRIVLDGLRGEDSIAELCRGEGISQGIYYKWSKDFMEAGKKWLAGDTARAANTDESLNNVTPADVYFWRDKTILQQRERIKRKTLEARRLHHRQRAA